jgi:acyl-coenzyme A thioesterase PaaI-like protein
VHEVVAVVQVNEPGEDVTVYPVIAAPPVETGAVQDTTAWAFAAPVALTAVGAPGTVDGVAAAEAIEAAPVPETFVAVTVNVYDVPFVRPVTVHDVVAVVQVNEPGEDVTVYELIEAPPLLTGAVQDTTDWVLAAPVALTAVGAPGTVDGVTAAEAIEAAPVPETFVAVTVNVYEVPFVRPATVHDVVAVVHVNEPGVEVTV